MVRLLLTRKEPKQAIVMLQKAAEEHPKEPRLQLMLVEMFMRQHKPEEAESALQKLIANHPDEERYRLSLARFYSINREWAKAEQAYLDAVRQSPESPWPLLMTARFFAGRGDWNKARAYLDQAEKLDPASPVPQNAKAELALDRGRLADARAILDKVLAKHALDPTAMTLKARIAMAENKPQEAVQILTEVIRARPMDLEALYRRAQAYARLNKMKLARADSIKVLSVDPSDTRARFMMATFQARSGEYLKAIGDIGLILAKDPKNILALDLRGRLYMAQGAYEKAAKDFQELIELSPKSSLGYKRMGMLYQSKNEPQKALASFEKALELRPNDNETLVRLAFMDLALKKPDAAIARVESQIPKLKRPELGYNLLGDLYQVLNKLPQAEKEYKKALARNSKLGGALMGLASVARRQGNLTASVMYLDDLLKLAPRSVQAMVAKGDVLSLMGNRTEAAEVYRQALNEDQDFVPALNNLAYLLTQRGGDKSYNEALPLAQRAKRLTPTDPRVLDTLGWLLYLRGAHQSALVELEEAAKLNQNNPHGALPSGRYPARPENEPKGQGQPQKGPGASGDRLQPKRKPESSWIHSSGSWRGPGGEKGRGMRRTGFGFWTRAALLFVVWALAAPDGFCRRPRNCGRAPCDELQHPGRGGRKQPQGLSGNPGPAPQVQAGHRHCPGNGPYQPAPARPRCWGSPIACTTPGPTATAIKTAASPFFPRWPVKAELIDLEGTKKTRRFVRGLGGCGRASPKPLRGPSFPRGAGGQKGQGAFAGSAGPRIPHGADGGPGQGAGRRQLPLQDPGRGLEHLSHVRPLPRAEQNPGRRLPRLHCRAGHIPHPGRQAKPQDRPYFFTAPP